MKLGFLNIKGGKAVRTIADYKQQILVKQGADQFKKLLEKGLNVPVVLL